MEYELGIDWIWWIVQPVYHISIVYWSLAIIIYITKIFSPSFDEITSYGKLIDNNNKINTTINRIVSKSSSSSSSKNHSRAKTKSKSNIRSRQPFLNQLLHFFKLDYDIVITKYGWMIFYCVAILLSIAMLVLIQMVKFKFKDMNIDYLVVFYVMMFIQGTRRLFETIYIQSHSHSMMNLLLFVSGCSYYVMVTVSPIAEYLNNYNQFNNRNPPQVSPIYYTMIIFIFILLSYNQYKIHIILSLIRKEKTNKTTEPSPTQKDKEQQDKENSINQNNRCYKIPNDDNSSINQNNRYYEIPNGNLFKYVSCPHFLMEILIYFTFYALSIFKSISLWMIVIFTSINLIHRSISTHKWYNTQFKTLYPRNRKAIIPFVL